MKSEITKSLRSRASQNKLNDQQSQKRSGTFTSRNLIKMVVVNGQVIRLINV